MIKLDIFDWSGVVSDDTEPVYEANMMLLVDHGHERISFEEWRRRSSLTAAGFLRNCGIDTDEKQTYATYKKYLNALVSDGHKPKLIPGVFDAVRELRKRNPLVVLSSHPEANLRNEMREYGLNDSFQLVYGNAVDKVTGLCQICDGLGIPRTKARYTGDTVQDIQAAKAAGLMSTAVCTGYHTRERLEAEKPDFMLEHLSWMVGI